MTTLSPARAKVLAFIRSEIATGKGFPSVRVIAAQMGWATAWRASEAMIALAALGHLRVVNRIPSGRGFKNEYEMVTAPSIAAEATPA